MRKTKKYIDFERLKVIFKGSIMAVYKYYLLQDKNLISKI